MPTQLLDSLKFHGQALLLRSQRQGLLAANIANGDTPNYKARDFDFGKALAAAIGVSGISGTTQATNGSATSPASSLNGSHAKHLNASQGGAFVANATEGPQYRQSEQARGDGNSVDMDRERANFADNAIRYEATLRFVNSGVRTLLTAIRGD